MTARTIKLDPALDREIDALAKSRNVSRSVIVRAALASYVRAQSKHPSALDAAGDLVGTLRGPGDLSTNKKHMRGYGE
jgi:predicted transcriptional regulator